MWRCMGRALLLGMGAAAAAAAAAAAPQEKGQSLAAALERAWSRTPQALALPAQHERVLALQARADGPTPQAPSVSMAGQRATRAGSQREFELELATPLWLPGQRGAARALADAQGIWLRARAEEQRLELAGRLREALWSLVEARLALEHAQRVAEDAAALHADVRRRSQAGELAALDEQMAAADKNLAEAGRLAAQRQASAAEAAWRGLTGDAGAPAASATPAWAESVGADRPAVPDDHPRLRQAQARVETARAHLALVERSASAAPELALRMVRERDAAGDPWGQRVGVVFKLPLSLAAERRADGAEARAELAEAQAELDRARSGLALELQQAVVALDLAEQRLELARARAQAAGRAQALQRRAYEAGEATLAEQLRAQGGRRAADAELDQAGVERARAVSALLQTMGVLP